MIDIGRFMEDGMGYIHPKFIKSILINPGATISPAIDFDNSILLTQGDTSKQTTIEACITTHSYLVDGSNLITSNLQEYILELQSGIIKSKQSGVTSISETMSTKGYGATYTDVAINAVDQSKSIIIVNHAFGRRDGTTDSWNGGSARGRFMDANTLRLDLYGMGSTVDYTVGWQIVEFY